jgi:hypothetical protein
MSIGILLSEQLCSCQPLPFDEAAYHITWEFLGDNAEYRIMPSEIRKLLRNRGKALLLLGIIWKRQQLRTEAFPTLSFGCVSEIPRKIERPSGPTIA